jgi:DNA recombination protein RmuC
METFMMILLSVIILGMAYIANTLRKKNDPIHQQIRDNFEAMSQKNERVLKEEMSINRKEVAESEKRMREEITTLFKSFGDPVERRMADLATTQNKNFEGFSTKLAQLIDKNEAKMDKVKEVVEKKLEGIQKDNSEKLEAMRHTVEEKLQSTLEKRLGESFKQVSDKLDSVHTGLGEMKNLATDVGGLKKVLTNVKTRGIWGEVQLAALLEQILSPEQYSNNVAVKRDGRERVEFAIKLPGAGDGAVPVWLPIDSKFPQEDYHRLVEAYEQANTEAIESASKQLELTIRSEAKSINEKYIDPPNTTDFAILFLPYESLYAEVVRRPGLCELIQRLYRVTITCPSTLGALLISLQMGFKTLAIQKRSSEVWEVLGAVKTQFGKFAGLLEKTQKQLKTVTNTIEDVTRKTKTIESKLKKVQQLPEASAVKVLKHVEEEEETEDIKLPELTPEVPIHLDRQVDIKPENFPF